MSSIRWCGGKNDELPVDRWGKGAWVETVSILIPCYNDGKHLLETLDSIWAQTWQNVEVIIADDGSEDKRTIDLLAEVERDGRCRVCHLAHQGPAAARNEALALAKGEYILPLDADDLIEPEYIQKAVEILKSDSLIGVCYCRADCFGVVQGEWDLPEFSVEQMLVDNVIFVSAVIRRTVFVQARGYDEAFKAGLEDYDFYLTVIENGWKFHRIPEILFHYRIKEKSRTHGFFNSESEYFKTYRRIYEKHETLFIQHAQLLIPKLREQIFTQRREIDRLNVQMISNRPLWLRRLCRAVKKAYGVVKAMLIS